MRVQPVFTVLLDTAVDDRVQVRRAVQRVLLRSLARLLRHVATYWVWQLKQRAPLVQLGLQHQAPTHVGGDRQEAFKYEAGVEVWVVVQCPAEVRVSDLG